MATALRSTDFDLILPWCVADRVPTERQHAFLMLDNFLEVLYGGAAGGGKTDAVLLAALQYVHVPGYSAAIFRRTFAQLSRPDSMLPRAAEWLLHQPYVTGHDSINGYPTRYEFRPYAGESTPAVLSFGHLQHEKDKYNHQSAAYQFVAFDELTQFTESQYTYLFSRLRKPSSGAISNVPLRIRSASNPGGEGHDWVRMRFPITDESSQHPDRAFVPAKLRDNPHLDYDSYVSSLSHLHPYDRQQLLDGDWDARPPGALVDRTWLKLINRDALPRRRDRVRFWDFAATEKNDMNDPCFTAGMLQSREEESGRHFLEDLQYGQWSEGKVARMFVQTAELDGRGVRIRGEQEPGSSGKIAAHYLRRLIPGYDFKTLPATGDKVVRMAPFASDAEAGLVYVVRGPWTEGFLHRINRFPEKPNDDGDATSGGHAALTEKRSSFSDYYGKQEEASA